MEIEGKRFCDFCGKEIKPTQKHVNFLVPGTTNKYEAYHARWERNGGDCWDRQIAKEKQLLKEKSAV